MFLPYMARVKPYMVLKKYLCLYLYRIIFDLEAFCISVENKIEDFKIYFLVQKTWKFNWCFEYVIKRQDLIIDEFWSNSLIVLSFFFFFLK